MCRKSHDTQKAKKKKLTRVLFFFLFLLKLVENWMGRDSRIAVCIRQREIERKGIEKRKKDRRGGG